MRCWNGAGSWRIEGYLRIAPGSSLGGARPKAGVRNENGQLWIANISETDNALSFELAIEMAPFFRLGGKDAGKLVTTVRTITSRWRRVARELNIPRSEQEAMEVAFAGGE